MTRCGSLTTSSCGYLGKRVRTGKIVATAINVPSQRLVVCDLDFWRRLDMVNFTVLILFLFVVCFWKLLMVWYLQGMAQLHLAA